jgi:dihydropteroate synthase
VIADEFLFLERSLEIARKAGVSEAQIVLDPGFGFSKRSEENLQLMARFGELQALGFPLLVGTSRKRLLTDVEGGDRKARDAGTAATSVILRLKGAAIFRVHNIPANKDALAFANAMLARGKPSDG